MLKEITLRHDNLIWQISPSTVLLFNTKEAYSIVKQTLKSLYSTWWPKLCCFFSVLIHSKRTSCSNMDSKAERSWLAFNPYLWPQHNCPVALRDS